MRSAAPARPAADAEAALVAAILDGRFPPGSALPAERGLATQLGVTRPTLREVLQRLARDGWITIQHGKPTRVNDYWREGGLNVLSALVRTAGRVPRELVPWLLEVRVTLGPTYTRAAVARAGAEVAALLEAHAALADTPEAFAAFDWRLHRCLTAASGNPIYALILNGFAGFYESMARRYFAAPAARALSLAFYAELLGAARRGDGAEAERVAREVLRQSIPLWSAAAREDGP